MPLRKLFDVFPEFDLDDIILRELREEDAAYYYRYMNHPKVAEYLADHTLPPSMNYAISEVKYWRDLFRYKRSFYWGIAEAKSNQLIGTAGYNSIVFDHLRAEISCDLDYDFWSKGIMSKTLQTILKFADEELKLIRIQATVAINNQKSINLMNKCDFKLEGNLKCYEIIKNQPTDYNIFGRIKNYPRT